MERVYLLPVGVLAGLGPPGRGVQGAQLRQALFLGRQGGFQSLGKLGVVHGHDPEPGLQLEDLYFSSGEFEIDGCRQCIPLVYGSKLLNQLTSLQVGSYAFTGVACDRDWVWGTKRTVPAVTKLSL